MAILFREFKDNLDQHLARFYAESTERYSQLAEANNENRLLYEGYDATLERRKNLNRIGETAPRHSLFIHDLTPAIQTIVSGVIAKLKETPYPVYVSPNVADAADREQVYYVQKELDRQLRECGFFYETLMEMLIGAEIYKTPSTVKVYPDFRPHKEAAISDDGARVVYRTSIEKYKPMVEWLPPSEFLYQPGVSAQFYYNSDYAIHRALKTKSEVLDMARAFNWDVEKIEGMLKDGVGGVSSQGRANIYSAGDHMASLEDEKGTSLSTRNDPGYHELCEYYVSCIHKSGHLMTYQIFTLGSSKILNDNWIDGWAVRGVVLPFVPVTASQLPGTIEGLSSVEIGKDIQRATSDLINAQLDYSAYTLFSPIVVGSGIQWERKPKFDLGKFIYANGDVNQIRPLITTNGQQPDLIGNSALLSERQRNLLNAHDTSQGFVSTPYEKATSVKQRVSGQSIRNIPRYQNYGTAIIRVAQLVIAMNQQYHHNREQFVVAGGWNVQVPSLTLNSELEQEKNDMLFLYSLMLKDPIFSGTKGTMKRLSLVRDIATRSFRDESMVNRYIPSDEEMESDIALDTEKQQVDQQIGMIEQEMAALMGAPPQKEASQ